MATNKSFTMGDGDTTTVDFDVNGTIKQNGTQVSLEGHTHTVVSQEILEVGTSNGWTYKKWTNGLYECSYTGTCSTAISTTWGNGYRSSNYYGGIAYPITFISQPNVVITGIDGGTDITSVAIQAGGSTATSPTFYFFRTSSQSSSSTHYYTIDVVGYWKTLESGTVGVPKIVGSTVITATDISYDNTNSGLVATEVQGAIDEIAEKYVPIVVDSGDSGLVSTTYNDTGTVSITFNKTFTDTPNMVVTLQNANTSASRYIRLSIDSKSTTGATIRWRNTATSSSGYNFSARFNWIAVGT